jgi:hypothetical protein
VPTPHADEATRLVQGMVGQYLPQLCVGAGDLQLRLSEGITIANVSGDGGLLVVCTPGGGLAIWPPA